jgi:hypothetical protein
MADTTKSASGRVEQAIVPSVPWTTSMLVMPRGQLRGQFFGGQRNHRRPPAQGLLKGLVDIAAGRQRSDGVALRKLLNNGEGALSDGTCGTENGEMFQNSSWLLATSF